MIRRFVAAVCVAALVTAGGAAAAFWAKDPVRSDCPGKVLCPLTGEEVCVDRCPLLRREDCPGRVVCPLTGEEVCVDRCPLLAGNRTSCCSEASRP